MTIFILSVIHEWFENLRFANDITHEQSIHGIFFQREEFIPCRWNTVQTRKWDRLLIPNQESLRLPDFFGAKKESQSVSCGFFPCLTGNISIVQLSPHTLDYLVRRVAFATDEVADRVSEISVAFPFDHLILVDGLDWPLWENSLWKRSEPDQVQHQTSAASLAVWLRLRGFVKWRPSWRERPSEPLSSSVPVVAFPAQNWQTSVYLVIAIHLGNGSPGKGENVVFRTCSECNNSI